MNVTFTKDRFLEIVGTLSFRCPYDQKESKIAIDIIERSILSYLDTKGVDFLSDLDTELMKAGQSLYGLLKDVDKPLTVYRLERTNEFGIANMIRDQVVMDTTFDRVVNDIVKSYNYKSTSPLFNNDEDRHAFMRVVVRAKLIIPVVGYANLRSSIIREILCVDDRDVKLFSVIYECIQQSTQAMFKANPGRVQKKDLNMSKVVDEVMDEIITRRTLHRVEHDKDFEGFIKHVINTHLKYIILFKVPK